MKPLTTNMNVWKTLVGIFLVLTILCVLCFYFSGISIVIVIGLVLILIINRIQRDVNKSIQHKKLSPTASKVYIYSLLLFWTFTLIFLLALSVDQLGSTVVELQQNNQTIAMVYTENINSLIPDQLEEDINTEEILNTVGSTVFSFLSGIFTALGSFFINAVLIIPLMLWMYYAQKDQIIVQTIKLVPKKFHSSIIGMIQGITTDLEDFFSAKLTESIVVGAICCFGFYVVGLDGWLFLGALAGLLNIVPYIGPLIGAIPPLLVALLDTPTVAIFVLITICIAQLIDNFYLIPFMITNKVRVNSLLGVILILVGAKLAGALGMIFALPVYIIYKTVLVSAYKELTTLYKSK